MSLYKDILFYLKQYGLFNLIRRIPNRLFRSIRPILQKARKPVAESSKSAPIMFFTYPGMSPRVNLVIQNDDNVDPYADHIMVFSITAAAAWGYDLRIISSPRININHFYDLLMSTGIKFKNSVEITSYEPDMANKEIDICEHDIFVAGSCMSASRIIRGVNEKKIICFVREVDDLYSKNHFQSKYFEMINNQTIHFVVQSRKLYDQLIADGFDNLQEKGTCLEEGANPDVYIKIVKNLSDITEMRYLNV